MEQLKEEIFKAEIKVEEQEKQQKQYTLYNYLIKQPTLMVSIISAFILIITFIFNSVLYVSTCNYLEY